MLIMMLCRRQLEHLVRELVLGRHREEDIALLRAAVLAVDRDNFIRVRLQLLVEGALRTHAQISKPRRIVGHVERDTEGVIILKILPFLVIILLALA